MIVVVISFCHHLPYNPEILKDSFLIMHISNQYRPLTKKQLFRIVRQVVTETYDNNDHFDIT